MSQHIIEIAGPVAVVALATAAGLVMFVPLVTAFVAPFVF